MDFPSGDHAGEYSVAVKTRTRLGAARLPIGHVDQPDVTDGLEGESLAVGGCGAPARETHWESVVSVMRRSVLAICEMVR